MQRSWTVALLLSTGCTFVTPFNPGKCELNPPSAPPRPVAAPALDHHQHLLNAGERHATLDYVRSLGLKDYALEVEREPLVDAEQLVQMLDSAGIAKALVLSNAYYFARSATEQAGEYDSVKADNDWTLAQIRRHPTRLYAACSVNPRRAYAVAEIERCAASKEFRALKMHFDASGVNVSDAQHVAAVRRAFAAANRLKLPIIVHLQSEAGPYGGAQARTFLEIVREAPDVPVTVNHFWGGGVYYPTAAEVLAVFAEAFQRNDPATRNLWFDIAQASMMVHGDQDRTSLAERMRHIGFGRLLYGSDGPEWSGLPPREHWDGFRRCMPLTRAEIDSLAANIAPYLR